MTGDPAVAPPRMLRSGLALIAGHRRNDVMLASAAAFLFGLCCLPTHVARLVVVPALLLGAAASLAPVPGVRIASFLHARDIQFLLFALVWTGASGIAAGTSLPKLAALFSNVLLLALIALVVRGLVGARLDRATLVLLFGFMVFGALLSIGVHLHSGQAAERLDSVALNGLIIPAAGGYACAILAALVLWRSSPRGIGRLAALGAGVIVLLAALVWSESRGPILSLALALLLVPIVERTRARLALATALVATFAITSSVIVFEDEIHGLLCASAIHRMCEPSLRLELWGWAVQSIARHPVFGVGFGNYFIDQHRPHPHNGLLSLAFFAGIPMAAAFIAVAIEAALRLKQAERSLLRLYAAASLVFGFGYMGTDLANALGFIGTHYLFVWLPIFVAFADGTGTPARSEGRSEPAGSGVVG